MCAQGQTAELLRLQSENEFLKGKVQLLEDQPTERDAQALLRVGGGIGPMSCSRSAMASCY